MVMYSDIATLGVYFMELEALKLIDETLAELSEDECARVIQWVLSKYSNAQSSHVEFRENKNLQVNAISNMNEIPGIARLTDEGSLKLTIRDLKAKNTNDAAIRLVHIIVFTYEKLTDENSVSSKVIVVPILKEWRAYTGNTRNVIAQHKGIIREGDLISLDAHAKLDAEKYINDVSDDSVIGSWKPASSVKSRKKMNK